MNDFSYCKKFLSYVDMKLLLVQLVPVAPCFLHVAPCEESTSASVLLVSWIKALTHRN